MILRHLTKDREEDSLQSEAKGTKKAQENLSLNRLLGQDLNLRPPGYEPDELPTALPSVVMKHIILAPPICVNSNSQKNYVFVPNSAFKRGKQDRHN